MYSQLNLFETSFPIVVRNNMEKVSGLSYLQNFITATDEQELLHNVDAGNWLNDLKRRVQHFGYKYDYRTRQIDTRMRIGKLPIWLDSIAVKLQKAGFFTDVPDQVIVNEYESGQGITQHIDCEPCFADTIVSLSLNSTAVMEFSRDDQRIPFLLEPRSIVILSNEARYEWQHSIPARKKDLFNGIVYHRKRRISLTFRKVII